MQHLRNLIARSSSQHYRVEPHYLFQTQVIILCVFVLINQSLLTVQHSRSMYCRFMECRKYGGKKPPSGFDRQDLPHSSHSRTAYMYLTHTHKFALVTLLLTRRLGIHWDFPMRLHILQLTFWTGSYPRILLDLRDTNWSQLGAG